MKKKIDFGLKDKTVIVKMQDGSIHKIPGEVFQQWVDDDRIEKVSEAVAESNS